MALDRLADRRIPVENPEVDRPLVGDVSRPLALGEESVIDDEMGVLARAIRTVATQE